MKKTLDLQIYIDDFDHSLTVDFCDPESGENSRIVLGGEEHEDFNERVGNEIYSYVAMWIDAIEEDAE